jgi:hypothetical protein
VCHSSPGAKTWLTKRVNCWRSLRLIENSSTKLHSARLDGKWDHDWSMQAIARHRIGVSKAKWVTAEFWADLEGGDPDDFAAGWYEPNAEDELCANIWTPLPAPPATLPRSSVSEQRTEVERLREALHNLIVLARPHFSDPTQMLALKQAQEAIATLVSSSNPDGGGVR